MAEGNVCWTEPNGTIGPCQYISIKLGGVSILAKEGSLTYPVGSYVAQGPLYSSIGGINSYYYDIYPEAPPTTTTTTTTTTTSTTTHAPVWYQLTNCNDNSTTYSVQYPFGKFVVGERVLNGASTISYNVAAVLSSNPGGTLISIFKSGYSACISTTTTTTQALSFTLTPGCAGIGTPGTGTLSASGFSGGTGTYSHVRMGSTLANAQAATPRAIGSYSTITWDVLTNGTYYVILNDSSGNSTYTTAVVSCTAISFLATPSCASPAIPGSGIITIDHFVQI